LNTLIKKPLLTAVTTFLVLAGFLIFNLNHERERLVSVQQQNITLSGEYLSELFTNTISQNIMTLENLRGRIEETEGSYFDYWEYDARLTLRQHPSFTLVEWIDSTGVIRRVEPEAGNEEAVGLDILQLDYRRDDWLRMKADSTTNFTSWTPLVQGGGAFLVDTPLYYGGAFHGSITAGMDFTQSFNEIMTGREMFNVEIRDDTGYPFYIYQNEPAAAGLRDISFEGSITIDASTPRTWEITIMPNRQFAEVTSQPILANIATRTVFAFLFAVLVYFMLVSYRASAINKKSLREKEVLISEIHHRVKNNLAVISGMIEIQLSDTDANDSRTIEVLRKTQGRINSIAGVHELLYDTDRFDEIPLRSYIKTMIDHLNDMYRGSGEEIHFELDTADEVLNINQAIPLGLLLNELITNSFKHAFKKVKEGKVSVTIRKTRGKVEVMFSNNGPGFDPGLIQKSEGIGFTLVRTLLSQLDAEYHVDMKDGFVIRFHFQEMNPARQKK
jgi:two-component sensor histidine kinase/sensor domain CHASE-containing protein